MPLIQITDSQHAWLKAYATQNDATMTKVLGMALDAFIAAPLPITHEKRWYVKMYLWEWDSLERQSRVSAIRTTGELPALAEAFVGAPGVAEMVRADLPRLRQVLARVQSTSARLYSNDRSTMLQIDVYRDRQADEQPEPENAKPLRVPLTP